MDTMCLPRLCQGIVFPSQLRSEAFGMSLLEGAMHGKPMISSEIGVGTTYINIAGEAGLVVPPGDSVALLRRCSFLWENPAVAAKMGGRRRSDFGSISHWRGWWMPIWICIEACYPEGRLCN